MAYNVYKNPPQSDFERQLREWNDRQPLNPSTYEDGTRITSGAGQVEIERFGSGMIRVYDEEGALRLADMHESALGSSLFPPALATDIRARVAEMRRLREESDKKKLAEAAILSHEELVEAATRQVRYTGMQPLLPSHSAEDILAAVVDDLCVPGDMQELADEAQELDMGY